MTSLLTNARAVGQQDNPNFKFLNLFGGVLDAKLELRPAAHTRAVRSDMTVLIAKFLKKCRMLPFCSCQQCVAFGMFQHVHVRALQMSARSLKPIEN